MSNLSRLSADLQKPLQPQALAQNLENLREALTIFASAPDEAKDSPSPLYLPSPSSRALEHLSNLESLSAQCLDATSERVSRGSSRGLGVCRNNYDVLVQIKAELASLRKELKGKASSARSVVKHPGRSVSVLIRTWSVVTKNHRNRRSRLRWA